MMTSFEQASCDLVMTTCDIISGIETLKGSEYPFGMESIFTDTVEGIQSFIQWLKKKLKEWINQFLQFVKSLRDTLLTWVKNRNNKFLQAITSTKPGSERFDNTTITIPYDLEKICETFRIITGHLPLAVKTTDSDTLKKEIYALHDMWNQVVLPKFQYRVTRADCCASCRWIVDGIRHLEAMSQTLSKNIKSVQTSLDRVNSPRELVGVMGKLVRGAEKLIRIDPTLFQSFLFYFDTSSITVEQLQQVVRSCIGSLVLGTVLVVNLTNPLETMISTISKIYNRESFELLYNTTIDPEFQRHIETMLQAPMEIGYIVVTTQEPNTWPTIGNSVIAGWCYAGTHRSGVKDLWINARDLLRNTDEQHLEPAIHRFLTIIVHECVHLWDAQHGGAFTEQGGHDSVHERKAYSMESSYKPTLRETLWAKHQIQTMLSLRK